MQIRRGMTPFRIRIVISHPSRTQNTVKADASGRDQDTDTVAEGHQRRKMTVIRFPRFPYKAGIYFAVATLFHLGAATTSI